MLDKPANHLVDGTGLDNVYGPLTSMTATTGMLTGKTGFHYSYALPVMPQNGGYIKSVTISFDVMVNGVQYTSRGKTLATQ